MAHKVTLRKKKITKGRKSLYLDFYPAIINPKTGKPTRREFLRMYIFQKPKTSTERQHNKDNLRIADAIRQRRENEVNKPEIYSAYEREILKRQEINERSFIDFYLKEAEKRTGSTRGVWLSAFRHLVEFNSDMKIKDLNEKTLNDLKGFLKSKLSANSASAYFSKVRTAIREAHVQELLKTDLNKKVKPIEKEDARRQYLTEKELNQVAKTECEDPILKKAALFSALTGLRYSDIEKLTYGEITGDKEKGYALEFRQKKTGGLETLPISNQAATLAIRETDLQKADPMKKAFEGLMYGRKMRETLARWIKKSGIEKKVTFHAFRHTFAVLQLANKTDIYTVSKMMGHKDLNTTQIYADILDEAKREAADRIRIDL